MALPADQRSRLLQAQLRGLIRNQWGHDDVDAAAFPAGAAARLGSTAWLLIDNAGPRSLGGPLLWAAKHEIEVVRVLVDASAEILAFEASCFDWDIEVWQYEKDQLALTISEIPRTDTAPLNVPEEMRAALIGRNLDLIAEGDYVCVELLGLEVGRIGMTDKGVTLESGIGRFDREVSQMMFRELDAADAVENAAELVGRHRFPGAPPHPLRDLGRERWMRHELLNNPQLVGADELTPLDTALPRPNLRETWPAMCSGTNGHTSVVVACTVGVDVDLIPLVAMTREIHDPNAQLIVVSTEPLPEPIRVLGAKVRGGTQFVTMAAPWVDNTEK